MSQLDSDDVPKTSSTGARRRLVQLMVQQVRMADPAGGWWLVQLMVQLPAQDLTAGVCRQLGDDRQLGAFDEFRRTRDADGIDVAQVTAAIKHRAVRYTATK